MSRVAGRFTRMIIATALLFFGANVIYAFGAGYLAPVALPTPFNVLATVVVGVILIWTVFRYVAVSTRRAS